MEHASSSLSLIEPDEDWNLWLTVDPRVKITPLNSSRTSIKAGIYSSVVGINSNEVSEIILPLIGRVVSRDVYQSEVESIIPGVGAAFIEQLIKNGILITSRYCPFSYLYARLASDRTTIGVSEYRSENTISKHLDSKWQLTPFLNRSPSCRSFRSCDFSDKEIGSCLKAAYGYIDSHELLPNNLLRRVVPSAGGIYPLRIAIRKRLRTDIQFCDFYYEDLKPAEFQLPNKSLDQVFNQPNLNDASILILIYADLEQIGRKYGERSYKYSCLEAGHVAQNIVLWAEHNSYRSLCLGGGDDELLSELAGGLQYLYSLAIGKAP